MKFLGKEQESSFLSTSLHLIFKSNDWICLLWKIDKFKHNHDICHDRWKWYFILSPHFSSTSLLSLYKSIQGTQNSYLLLSLLPWQQESTLNGQKCRETNVLTYLRHTFSLIVTGCLQYYWLLSILSGLMKVLSGTWISPTSKLRGLKTTHTIQVFHLIMLAGGVVQEPTVNSRLCETWGSRQGKDIGMTFKGMAHVKVHKGLLET